MILLHDLLSTYTMKISKINLMSSRIIDYPKMKIQRESGTRYSLSPSFSTLCWCWKWRFKGWFPEFMIWRCWVVALFSLFSISVAPIKWTPNCSFGTWSYWELELFLENKGIGLQYIINQLLNVPHRVGSIKLFNFGLHSSPSLSQSGQVSFIMIYESI